MTAKQSSQQNTTQPQTTPAPAERAPATESPYGELVNGMVGSSLALPTENNNRALRQHRILQMQRHVGNKFVQRSLAQPSISQNPFIAVQRQEPSGPPGGYPPPPGVTIGLTPFQATYRGVLAAESGGGSVPSPGNQFSVSASNFTKYAAYCTQIQTHYGTKAKSNPLPSVLPDHYSEQFAAKAGESHGYCAGLAGQLNTAQQVAESWVPIIDIAQKSWRKAKVAIEQKLALDMQTGQGGGGMDTSTIKPPAEGEMSGTDEWRKTVEGTEKLADVANDTDLKAAKQDVRDSVIEYNKAVSDVNQWRNKVQSSHQKASPGISELIATAQAALGKEKTKEADINKYLTVANQISSAVTKGMSIANQAKAGTLVADTMQSGSEAAEAKVTGTGAGDIAKFILMIDGTLSGIQANIVALDTATKNLQGIVDVGRTKGLAQEFHDALDEFKKALKHAGERTEALHTRHEIYAERLAKKLGMSPSEAKWLKDVLAATAQLHESAALVSNAASASNAVKGSIDGIVASLGAPPKPDVCQLANLVKQEKKVYVQAQSLVGTIANVLRTRAQNLTAAAADMQI